MVASAALRTSLTSDSDCTAGLKNQPTFDKMFPARVPAFAAERKPYHGSMNIDRLIRIDELAERLQLSERWIRDEVNAGRLPCIILNSRTWRFHWPTVLEQMSGLQ